MSDGNFCQLVVAIIPWMINYHVGSGTLAISGTPITETKGEPLVTLPVSLANTWNRCCRMLPIILL